MKGEEKHKRRKDQIALSLEDMFYNKAFVLEIEALRKKVGIPRHGYKKFASYYKYMLKDFKNVTYLHDRISSAVFNLPIKYGLPSNYAYWVEAFMALGFNYKEMEVQMPYNQKREYFIYGLGCALDIQYQTDDHINLAIFPGTSLNTLKDFLAENEQFIKSIQKSREHLGKTPSVRKVRNRDRLEILRLADLGDIDSTGTWLPGLSGNVERPDCIQGIGINQIKNIIAEERRKRKIREGKIRK